jgi:hypothetical protein
MKMAGAVVALVGEVSDLRELSQHDQRAGAGVDYDARAKSGAPGVPPVGLLVAVSAVS